MTEMPDFSSTPPPLWLYLILTFVSAVLVTIWCYNFLQQSRGRRNQNRGRKAEKRAKKLLKKAGYTIVAHHPGFTSVLLVNGEEELFDVTPDLLVTKDGQTYVVEVKRYRDNSTITNAGVRRQVLEYMVASDLPCLLMQMPEGDMAVIDLPELPEE